MKRKTGQHISAPLRNASSILLLLILAALAPWSEAFAQEPEARAEAAPTAPVTTAQEREPRERRRRDDDAVDADLQSLLNLSTEQRAQIRSIRQQAELDVRPLLQRQRQARRALDRAIYQEDASESVVEERVRELVAAQAELVRMRALTDLRLRRLLTPEQLDVMRRLRSEHQRRRLERRRRVGAAVGGSLPGSRPPANTSP